MSIVRNVELRMIGLPLVRPFRTSFGTSTAKECILVRVETDEGEGWGECVADVEPGYSEEFNEGAWLVIRDHLAPALLRADHVAIDDLDHLLGHVRGNPMAKAALIDAVVDARLRADGVSLAQWLGADRDRVACGVSIGITDTTEGLVDQVDGYLAEGYRRIKLKIEPGIDIERVGAVRAAHPDIALSVDANAAYTIEDQDVFRALDAYDLLMIEQPLHHTDLVRHAELQRAVRTDLCLDEVPSARARVAGQREPRHRREGEVLRPSDPGLEHASAPDRHSGRPTGVVHPPRLDDATHPSLLDVHDATAAQLERRDGVGGRPDRFVETQIRADRALKLGVAHEVGVMQRLLDHQ